MKKAVTKTALSLFFFLITRHDLVAAVSAAAKADMMGPPHFTTLRASDQVEGRKGVM